MAAPAQAAAPGVIVNSYPDAGRAVATGAHEVRMVANWGSFEPKQGKVDQYLRKALVDAIALVNKADRKVMVTVTGAPAWANGGHADSNYAPLPAYEEEFAAFARDLVKHAKSQGAHIDRLQPWNEPNDPQYWKPQPSDADRYASLLTRTHDAVKAADPAVQIVAAGTAGNDYDWIDGMFKRGARFDAVAVDSDTSCRTDDPSAVYREADGRLGKFTFVGFTEVLSVLAANGAAEMPLIMGSLGVSSTNGGATSCSRGTWAGKKPSGVSEDEQARILTASYRCLAGYPQVVAGYWSQLDDRSPLEEILDEFRHYGLFGTGGAAKPALRAFKEIAASNGGTPGLCADLTPPALKILAPSPGEQFEDRLDIRVSASDGDGDGVGLGRISLFSPLSPDSIRNFTHGLADHTAYGLSPWFGSRTLALGKHTLRVTALDKNGNVATQTVEVEKVRPGTIKPTRTARYALPRRVLAAACTKRARKPRCTADFGNLQPVTDGPSIQGKVAVEWQWHNKKGQWRKLIGGTKAPNARLAFDAALPRKGRWRVRAVYNAYGHYKTVRTKFFAFVVR